MFDNVVYLCTTDTLVLEPQRMLAEISSAGETLLIMLQPIIWISIALSFPLLSCIRIVLYYAPLTVSVQDLLRDSLTELWV